MKAAAIIALLIALVGSGFGQQKKPAASAKPVSGYMRDSGVLYLEAVDSLTLKCGQMALSDSDCESNWNQTLDGLEDRINITLSESKRPSGDKPFWELLRLVRYTRHSYVFVDPGLHTGSAWSHAYIVCASRAHAVALEGEYFNSARDGCETALEAATHPVTPAK
jgi:hypothetical protein